MLAESLVAWLAVDWVEESLEALGSLVAVVGSLAAGSAAVVMDLEAVAARVKGPKQMPYVKTKARGGERGR